MSTPIVSTNLSRMLKKAANDFHPIIKFDAAKEKFFPFDFSERSKHIPSSKVIADTNLFSNWVSETLSSQQASFGIGGYNENRVLYRRSELFSGEEARSIPEKKPVPFIWVLIFGVRPAQPFMRL